MAGIDKTYTSSYDEYLELKNWIRDQTVTFYNGYKVRLYDYLWEYTEEDFNFDNPDTELPVFNTPTWMDIYLIQNCPVQFVQDRMREVRSKEEYEEFKTMEFPPKFPKHSDEFKQNRKIKIKTIPKKTKFPIHDKAFHGRGYWVECDDYDYWYDTESKTWSNWEHYYPYNTNMVQLKSLKAIVRHLRKQYLPSGITFTINGAYIGECYKIVVK